MELQVANSKIVIDPNFKIWVLLSAYEKLASGVRHTAHLSCTLMEACYVVCERLLTIIAVHLQEFSYAVNSSIIFAPQ